MLNLKSGQSLLGLWLAVTAIACWGLLPVVSKGVLDKVDPYTLNFYRFVAATVVLPLYMVLKKGIHVPSRLDIKQFGLLIMAVLGLLANHIMFMDALQFIPAGSSQIIIQLGPIALLLLCVLVLNESFSSLQWLGTLVFVSGLVLFFNDRLLEIVSASSEYALGTLYMTGAALVWIFYGMGQKLLSGRISPVFLLFCCYSLGMLVLLPSANLGIIFSLDQIQLALLLASCFVSLVAYICFGESLVRWEASKSSALLAFIPLATLAYEYLFALVLPGYTHVDALNGLSIFGALLVVFGCLVVANPGANSGAKP